MLLSFNGEWTVYAACMQNLVGKPKGKRPHENLCTDGKITLEWILEETGW
jgi:hypothetical protein